MSTYDFSTLSLSTLPHNLFKRKITELIEKKIYRGLACNEKRAFCTCAQPKRYNLICGPVRICLMHSNIFWTIYL